MEALNSGKLGAFSVTTAGIQDFSVILVDPEEIPQNRIVCLAKAEFEG